MTEKSGIGVECRSAAKNGIAVLTKFMYNNDRITLEEAEKC